MSVMTEIRDIALALAARYSIPKIAGIVFPPFSVAPPPPDCEFMALALEGGGGGVSYVLIEENRAGEYAALRPQDFIGKRPEQLAEAFGRGDSLADMLGLAAINALCQQVMRAAGKLPDVATDSIGLLNPVAGDRIGMVGFFPPLLKHLIREEVELVIIEKNPALHERYPKLPITLDSSELENCNKVLCTSTTVLNDTIEEVLGHCTSAEHISVLGPTAGYFPDPLFDRGVDVLGGRLVNDGMLLLKLVAEGKRWGEATQKLCFQAGNYAGYATEFG